MFIDFKISPNLISFDHKIMDNYTWERVADDDPRRCQGTNNQGQCHNKAVTDSNYCPAHGGNKAAESAERKRMRNYRLAKFKARVTELGDSDNITSLKDEVAILRMLIEERINRCNDSHELLLVSGPLSDLIMKCEKLVTSCHRLDSRLGNLLDRSKILQFAQVVIEIIGKYVTDEDDLESIGDEILKALGDV
jgi:hypothetical protein